MTRWLELFERFLKNQGILNAVERLTQHHTDFIARIYFEILVYAFKENSQISTSYIRAWLKQWVFSRSHLIGWSNKSLLLQRFKVNKHLQLRCRCLKGIRSSWVSDHLPCICLIVTNHKLLLFLQSLNNQAGEHLDSRKSSETGTIYNCVDCVNWCFFQDFVIS